MFPISARRLVGSCLVCPEDFSILPIVSADFSILSIGGASPLCRQFRSEGFNGWGEFFTEGGRQYMRQFTGGEMSPHEVRTNPGGFRDLTTSCNGPGHAAQV